MSNASEPLYIINGNIIGNSIISSLNSANFKGVIVYKNQDGPGILKNLSSTGIIAITYDGQISSKSFAEIGNQLGLHGSLSFIVNGHKLDATQLTGLRIVPEAIGTPHITKATLEVPETTVNIQTVESKSSAQRSAPGTIMIR
ncbi:hypothetical protein GCM10027422_32660 [Hymenobacter arcticus]